MTDPERATDGARQLPGVEVGAMCPLEAADVVVVPAEHVGRSREQLKILRAERRGPIARDSDSNASLHPLAA